MGERRICAEEERPVGGGKRRDKQEHFGVLQKFHWPTTSASHTVKIILYILTEAAGYGLNVAAAAGARLVVVYGPPGSFAISLVFLNC